MSLIELDRITMNYHSLENETQALKEITFNVDKGEFVSIVGPSGCGKSTLLNIISGLLKPSSGMVRFNRDGVTNNLDEMGYMFQRDYLFEWLTVWGNIILGLKIKKQMINEKLEEAEKLLEQYGLKNFRNHKPNELSGGMRQRVALIRTLALKPEVLLLDEPFSALDYQTRLMICDEVHNIIKAEAKTAIMVTHDLGEAISISDRVIVLTKSPATIVKDMKIDFENKGLTPFKKRKEKEYNYYFNLLWKELDIQGEK